LVEDLNYNIAADSIAWCPASSSRLCINSINVPGSKWTAPRTRHPRSQDASLQHRCSNTGAQDQPRRFRGLPRPREDRVRRAFEDAKSAEGASWPRS